MSEGVKVIDADSKTISPVKKLANVARVIPNLNIEFWNFRPSPEVLKYLTS